MANKSGIDTLMELSTGGDFRDIRRRAWWKPQLSLGSVPLYLAFIEAIRKWGANVDMSKDDLFRAAHIAPGHDHIVEAVGASLSSAGGADFICYATVAEHPAHRNLKDVRGGVITNKIAGSYWRHDQKPLIARKIWPWSEPEGIWSGKSNSS